MVAVHDLDRQQRESLKLSKLSKDQQKKKDNRAKKHLEVDRQQHIESAELRRREKNSTSNRSTKDPDRKTTITKIRWTGSTNFKFAKWQYAGGEAVLHSSSYLEKKQPTSCQVQKRTSSQSRGTKDRSRSGGGGKSRGNSGSRGSKGWKR
ncbi:MAG: hypothetical protein CMJ72_13965 [Planctomycetaceae bacterium]|nr:hypothetical protein [Planctomycetaceae bacterium]HCK40689.1 hypothetical protein [Planctomycetaceae bacterium]